VVLAASLTASNGLAEAALVDVEPDAPVPELDAAQPVRAAASTAAAPAA
jgi:hypothetical protein